MPGLINNKIALFFQGLAHPTRLEILELLKEKESLCVCEIVACLKKEQSGISRHLSFLKLAGIIDFNSKGNRSIYKIKDKTIYKLIDTARSILYKELKEQQKVLTAL